MVYSPSAKGILTVQLPFVFAVVLAIVLIPVRLFVTVISWVVLSLAVPKMSIGESLVMPSVLDGPVSSVMLVMVGGVDFRIVMIVVTGSD